MGSGRSGEHKGRFVLLDKHIGSSNRYCYNEQCTAVRNTDSEASVGMRLTQGVICDEHWKDPSKGWVYIDDVKASIVQNKQTLDG